MDGVMIARTIEALTSSLNTIKKIWLREVNWNTEAALTQLLQFIANAPKLEACDVGN